MNFSKIKWSAKDRKVTLAWSETHENGDEITHSLTSPDAPRPEFLKALNGLSHFASGICDCGEWGHSLRAIGVSLSTSSDGAEGLVITCLRNVTISPAPVVLNTPHLAEDAWPHGLSSAIDLLAGEAELYLGGNRAQTEMFADAAAT